MQVTASAISLNVPDVQASADFLKRHFFFRESMAIEGSMSSLTRDDVGFNLIYLKTGLESFQPSSIAGQAGQGLLVVLVVTDVDAEHERLTREGAPIITPIQTEPWGERFLQVQDPNGIVIQLVQWLTTPPDEGKA